MSGQDESIPFEQFRHRTTATVLESSRLQERALLFNINAATRSRLLSVTEEDGWTKSTAPQNTSYNCTASPGKELDLIGVGDTLAGVSLEDFASGKFRMKLGSHSYKSLDPEHPDGPASSEDIGLLSISRAHLNEKIEDWFGFVSDSDEGVEGEKVEEDMNVEYNEVKQDYLRKEICEVKSSANRSDINGDLLAASGFSRAMENFDCTVDDRDSELNHFVCTLNDKTKYRLSAKRSFEEAEDGNLSDTEDDSGDRSLIYRKKKKLRFTEVSESESEFESESESDEQDKENGFSSRSQKRKCTRCEYCSGSSSSSDSNDEDTGSPKRRSYKNFGFSSGSDSSDCSASEESSGYYDDEDMTVDGGRLKQECYCFDSDTSDESDNEKNCTCSWCQQKRHKFITIRPTERKHKVKDSLRTNVLKRQTLIKRLETMARCCKRLCYVNWDYMTASKVVRDFC